MTDQFNTRYKTLGDNPQEFELIGANALVHSGAFGTGFKGHTIAEPDRIWLIKQAQSRDYASQFTSEYTTLQQLNACTPHTPWPVYEAHADSENGLPALIMPFYTATLIEALNRVVQRDAYAAEVQLTEALLQHLDVLDALHQLGYTRVDYKPEDFFWEADQLIEIDWNVLRANTPQNRVQELHKLGEMLYAWLTARTPVLPLDPFARDSQWTNAYDNTANGAVAPRWSMHIQRLTSGLLTDQFGDPGLFRAECLAWRAWLTAVQQTVQPSEAAAPPLWKRLTASQRALLQADALARFGTTAAIRRTAAQQRDDLLLERSQQLDSGLEGLANVLRQLDDGRYRDADDLLTRIEQTLPDADPLLMPHLAIERWRNLIGLLQNATIAQDGIDLFAARKALIDAVELLGATEIGAEASRDTAFERVLTDKPNAPQGSNRAAFDMIYLEIDGRLALLRARQTSDLVVRTLALQTAYESFSAIRYLKPLADRDLLQELQRTRQQSQLGQTLDQAVSAVQAQAVRAPNDALRLYGEQYSQLRSLESGLDLPDASARPSRQFVDAVRPWLRRAEFGLNLADPSRLSLWELLGQANEFDDAGQLSLTPDERRALGTRITHLIDEVQNAVTLGTDEDSARAERNLALLERIQKRYPAYVPISYLSTDEQAALTQVVAKQRAFFAQWPELKETVHGISNDASIQILKQAIKANVDIYKLPGETRQLSRLLAPLLEGVERLQGELDTLGQQLESQRQRLTLETTRLLDETSTKKSETEKQTNAARESVQNISRIEHIMAARYHLSRAIERAEQLDGDGFRSEFAAAQTHAPLSQTDAAVQSLQSKANQFDKAFQNAQSKLTLSRLDNLRLLYVQLVEDHRPLDESQQSELAQAQRQLDEPLLQAPLRYLAARAAQLTVVRPGRSGDDDVHAQLIAAARDVCRVALDDAKIKPMERIPAIQTALQTVMQTFRQPGVAASALGGASFVRDWQSCLQEATLSGSRLAPLLERIRFWPRYKNTQKEIDELCAVAYALEEMSSILSARAFYLIFPLWRDSMNEASHYYAEAYSRLKSTQGAPTALENLFVTILKRGEAYCQSGKMLIQNENALLESVAGTRKV